MKLFFLLLSLSCAEPLEFYCENITYKYLLQKGERVREHHRATLGRSKDAGRSLSALCSTGYLEFYRELMLSTRTCSVTLETQIPGDEEFLEFPRNPEKEWTKNFASPECGSKLGKIKWIKLNVSFYSQIEIGKFKSRDVKVSIDFYLFPLISIDFHGERRTFYCIELILTWTYISIRLAGFKENCCET